MKEVSVRVACQGGEKDDLGGQEINVRFEEYEDKMYGVGLSILSTPQSGKQIYIYG